MNRWKIRRALFVLLLVGVSTIIPFIKTIAITSSVTMNSNDDKELDSNTGPPAMFLRFTSLWFPVLLPFLLDSPTLPYAMVLLPNLLRHSSLSKSVTSAGTSVSAKKSLFTFPTKKTLKTKQKKWALKAHQLFPKAIKTQQKTNTRNCDCFQPDVANWNWKRSEKIEKQSKQPWKR